ncbi:protein PTST homolog 3, chloroplastic isoform X2 [Ricinus communis]|uniref:protein PTST homolog 3, chloroplastic isoform X2 n=1 Tax=Ricinus communis TaxID=3988 RepID=UPI000772959D|nr:protein PTST homolog 3, chloroplastic isoform X2 [Ricinus communis]|eukprot:XP_015574890.1 protein PTST homolog 3, chloroplastic isoform X2 [Ricinus communis]
MATLNQSTCFLSLSSHKLFLNQEECKIVSNTHHYRPRKDFNFCICSAKKSRGGRKVKSNVELCNDIREFVSAVGLPQGHVPSMKELSDHGRNDLAHIVRRRGYKLIRELLSNSVESELGGSNIKKSVDEVKDTITDSIYISEEGQDGKVEDVIEESALSTEVLIKDHSDSASINPECNSSVNNCMPIESSLDVSLNEVKSMDNINTSSTPSFNIEKQDQGVQLGAEDIALPAPSDFVEPQDREVLNMAEVNPLPTEVLITDNSHGSLNGYSGPNSNTKTCSPVKALDNASLEEKALNIAIDQDEKVNSMAEVISLRSEVSNLEYPANDGSMVLGLNYSNRNSMPVDPAANSLLEDKVAKFIQSGDLDAIEDETAEESKGSSEPENETEIQSETPTSENDKHADNGSNAPLALNGSISISKDVSPPMRANHPVRNDELPAEGLASFNVDKDLDVEISKRENHVEINHLKFMLHQKELELSHLKEQIEKEKIALSDLQNKAEMEIKKAQKLISEKDAELLAAEESLSGLMEVKIQYNGDGEIVEVAGSFNGWHHRIKMDPQPSSSVRDPAASRKSKLWSIMLWLYPGVYEIKFIVDGHWTIDPQGEMVTRGGICNNVLRVIG